MEFNRLMRCALPIAIVSLAGLPAGLAQADDQSFLDVGGELHYDDAAASEEFFVELHVNDEDLAAVLQMLSIQSQRNIVMSQGISARVTANLYGVTFYEAMDAILHVNGYGYIERGNFIYVYTLEELNQIQQASRLRQTAVVRLNFLNAIDAAEFATPLLSDGGQIKTNGATTTFSIPDNAPIGADEFAHDATLVVFDYPENIDAIAGLIAELDTRPAQVLVEATILQAQLNEANAFGVDFSIIADLNFGDFLNVGGPLNPVDGLLSGEGQRIDASGDQQSVGIGRGTAGQSNVANIDGPSTLKMGVVTNNVSVFVRMLDEVTDTTILSKPKILSLNRQPARVLVGRRVGYLSTTATDTSTTQTVEFLDTGTQLYFRPFITSDGLIRMELKPQVSEAIIRNVTDSGGVAVTIPDEITNELTANVMVRDGNTIVLGGLFRESIQASRRQIPLLGDIPLIGAAFRGHNDETNRSEIIFMITPTIVSDDFLAQAGREASDYVDHVRAGSRNGLLLFSRERQSSQLLLEARELAAKGDTRKALHKVQRSLQLNPNQPDAIKLRAQITGETKDWPTRSLLDDILDREADAVLGSLNQRQNPAAANNNQRRAGGLTSNGANRQPTPEPPQASKPAEPEPVFETSDFGFQDPDWSDLGLTENADTHTLTHAEPEPSPTRRPREDAVLPFELTGEFTSELAGAQPEKTADEPDWFFAESDTFAKADAKPQAATPPKPAQAPSRVATAQPRTQNNAIDPSDPLADAMDFLIGEQGAAQRGEIGLDLSQELAEISGFTMPNGVQSTEHGRGFVFGSLFSGSWSTIKNLGGNTGELRYSNVQVPE